MKFGTEKTTTDLDDIGSTGSLVNIYRDGEVAKSYKQFKIRVKVADTQQEMAEFIRWSDDMREKRKDGTLVLERTEDNLMPTFTVQYPRFDNDGSYFVVRCWTETVN